MFEKIYIDMDGVIADFDSAAELLIGEPFGNYEQKYGPISAWDKVYEDPLFFVNMQPFPHMRDLLSLCWKHTNMLVILSSPSRTNTPLCVIQKRLWIDKHLGPTFPAIFEKEKHKFVGPNKLLIDDTIDKVSKWIEAGGIGHLFQSHEGLVKFFKEETNGNNQEI